MAREARPLPPTIDEVDGDDWYGRTINGETFDGVLFREVDLTEAVTTGATFTGCVFRDVRFNASRHAGSAFLNCAFVQSSFFDARFEGCKLTGSWFDRCTFTSFAVEGGDWSFVGLAGADLGKASIVGARLREADLTGVKAVGATLRECDLTGAWLHNADLTRADLRGSDLATLDPSAVSLAGAQVLWGQAVQIATSLGLDVVDECGDAMSQWAGTFESGAIGVPMKVGPVTALTRAVRGAFQTRGRSSRSEYWWFQLWIALVLGAALAFDIWRNGPVYTYLVATLLVLAPAISVCVRRLHDAGYSGAWYFVQFLPFIGWVWLLVLVIQPSKRLATQYGPGPDDHLLH